MRRALSTVFLLAFASLSTVPTVLAQEQGPPLPPAQQQPQAQATPQQLWPADQLDNLVAPIALYPDPLLGQILVASTYPLEVVEASQWLQRNKNLQGQALIDAAKQQPWDPSIQALVAVQDALAKLNQDIRWTTDLGNAFLAQQADVMSAVQRMRSRAQASGRLSSTPQQTVTTEEQGGQDVIVIQPANPQVIYVPVYDPYYVWGPPVWGYYPALYYPYFGFGFGPGFNLGFCFGNWGGWFGWGWGPNWFGHSVYVNNYFFDHYGYHNYGHHGGGYHGKTAWSHDPGHRMHVPYQSDQVASRYGAGSMGFRNAGSPRTGPGGGTTPYTNRPGGRTIQPATQQAYRNTSPQAQQYRNPERQRYQSSQQYTPSSQQYRAQPQAQSSQGRSSQYQSAQQYRSVPQAQQAQNQAQQRYVAPQQSRSSSQLYRTEPQTQRYLSPSQSYQSGQQYRSAPQVQRYQNQPQSYQSPQQYRAAPQVQRFQSQAQPRYQAPQQQRSFTPQYRSAPQMSAPRSGGSPGFSRGGASSFSGGGGFSRGGGGFSRGGGGGHRH